MRGGRVTVSGTGEAQWVEEWHVTPEAGDRTPSGGPVDRLR